jgi:L-lactate dehydrogenase complex protein LldE
MNISAERVSLFIPCMVDQVYPEMGTAMVRVLRRLGVEVAYDRRQTCCGQPAFNAGHRVEALKVARGFVQTMGETPEATLVGLSGSCAAMVANFYPTLFEGDPARDAACALGDRIYEFGQYLCVSGLVERLSGTFSGRVGFHNSCHSLRELGLKDEGFQVLGRITGYELCQPAGDPVCCGFGGVFSVKFADIAGGMACTRLEQFRDLGVETLVSNDPGCIMHLRQESERLEMPMRFLHLAEFLDEAMG